MRKPFCNFIFDLFPSLQQYANISYKFGYSVEDSNNQSAETARMLQSENVSILLNSRTTNIINKNIKNVPLFGTEGFTIECPD